MDATTRLKLEELRKVAFKRLETDKRMVKPLERQHIFIAWRKSGASDTINEQIHQNLRTHPLYDCLAMWLDPDAGLAHYEPELLLDIGKRLLDEAV